MAESVASPQSRGGLRRILRTWAVTAGFLAGLLVGAVVTGLLSQGAPLPSEIGGGTAAPERTADPSPDGAGDGSAGATGQVAIDEACLRAINAAQDVVGVVEDLGEALSQFNPARLDEIVRRLQPLERRLRENAEACEVEGQVSGDTSSEDGEASPSPTASPTD